MVSVTDACSRNSRASSCICFPVLNRECNQQIWESWLFQQDNCFSWVPYFYCELKIPSVIIYSKIKVVCWVELREHACVGFLILFPRLNLVEFLQIWLLQNLKILLQGFQISWVCIFTIFLWFVMHFWISLPNPRKLANSPSNEKKKLKPGPSPAFSAVASCRWCSARQGLPGLQWADTLSRGVWELPTNA